MATNPKPSPDAQAAVDHSMLDEEFMGEDLRPPEVSGDEKSAEILKRHARRPGADPARPDDMD